MTRRTALHLFPLAGLIAQGRARRGHLRARPHAPSSALPPGEHPLGLADGRDGLLIVPPGHRADRPAPLAVLLHGAGGRARRVVSLLGMAGSLGIIVLAPESRGTTWDVVTGDYGPDVEFVNRALAIAFERCAIDPSRLAIGGFSDGATCALALGLDNGDLFTHILAFSPGFAPAKNPQGGRPRIFVSHGTRDEVLPIAATSRRIVPALDRAGYDVRFREFDGPHTVPPAVAHEALDWFRR